MRTTTTKHTPAPWSMGGEFTHADGWSAVDIYGPRVDGNDGAEHIAQIAVEGPHDYANARLIATAPLMAHELTTLPCVTEFDDQVECDDDNLCVLCAKRVKVLAQLDGEG